MPSITLLISNGPGKQVSWLLYHMEWCFGYGWLIYVFFMSCVFLLLYMPHKFLLVFRHIEFT